MLAVGLKMRAICQLWLSWDIYRRKTLATKFDKYRFLWIVDFPADFRVNVVLQNEEILKKATTDYQDKLKKSEEKYRLLKKHAEEKIERFVFIVISKLATWGWYCAIPNTFF